MIVVRISAIASAAAIIPLDHMPVLAPPGTRAMVLRAEVSQQFCFVFF